MEESNEKAAVSFGFSKKSDKKTLLKSNLNDTETENVETDFITSLEGRQVKSVKPKEEKKDIVIPLIKTNNWRTKTDNQGGTDRPPPKDGIESQAVQELLNDIQKQNENWETRGTKTDTSLQIPLLMQNAVPEGYETEDRLDVSLRPEEPEDADFDEVPIEAFGMAMLRGMGWKPGMGIGKNTKAVAPVEATLRPKGMGLGADRKQAQNLNSAKQGSKPGSEREEDGELVMKKGTCCLVEKGPHKDLYGMIEGMDEDNARLMIKLTVSGKSVTVSQYNTKLVSKKEYDKYSKYLNKGSADRYREKEQKKDKHRDNRDREDDRERKSEKGRDRERESESERKHRKEEDRLSDYGDRKDRDYEDKKDRHKEKESRKRKHEDDRSQSSYSNGQSTSQDTFWVRPNLRVRIVDEKYKKGKYYNTKVVVVDVADRDHCVCKTDEGKVLAGNTLLIAVPKDVPPKMLETVIPRSDSSYVCIVTGKHKCQIGHVLERHKKKGEALVQLLSDRDKVLTLDFDSICEYVGDVNEEFDF